VSRSFGLALWRWGSLLCVLVVLWPAAGQAADSPRIFEIQAECSEGMRVGNAFLVGNWRSEAGAAGQPKLLLATAMHLVHGCDRLAVYEVNCDEDGRRQQVWDVPAAAELTVWPGLDLVALAVPPDKEQTLAQGRVAVLADKRRPLAAREVVDVRGSSRTSVCMGGLGFVLGATNASTLASHLARRGGAAAGQRDPKRIRGSLSRSTRLVQYWGSPTGGTSGAPVTRPDDPMTVIGVHQGGDESANVSWAVLLAADLPSLASSTTANLGQWDDVAAFARPAFSQSAALDASAARVRAEARRWADSQFVITAGVDFGAAVVAGPAQFFVAPRFGLSAELIEWPAATRSSSLAAHVGGGLRLGTVTHTFVDPFDEPMEQLDMTATMGWLDLGLELRLRRRARLRPSIRLGVRVGSTDLPAPDGSPRTTAILGFPLSVELAMSPGHGYHAIVLRLSGAMEHGPGARHAYTGLGSHYASEPADWGGIVAVGVGYAY